MLDSCVDLFPVFMRNGRARADDADVARDDTGGTGKSRRRIVTDGRWNVTAQRWSSELVDVVTSDVNVDDQ